MSQLLRVIAVSAVLTTRRLALQVAPKGPRVYEIDKVAYEAVQRASGVCAVHCMPEGQCELMTQTEKLKAYGITGQGNGKCGGFMEAQAFGNVAIKTEKWLTTPTGPCKGMTHTAKLKKPAATSMNLEYLAVVLQARLRKGKETFFSLDPVEGSTSTSMQEKKFDPEWLADTSVGDVLFQADYHLKELSMGEAEQPNIGMKICLNSSNQDSCSKDWNAHEWLVVKNAEVQLSERNASIPQVKTGVEAREQVMGADGSEDVKRTKPDHPLVKYAESFTHNFDLFVERKSVLYNLRELAKAPLMAKFLLDTDAEIDQFWLDSAVAAPPRCGLEAPPPAVK